MQDVPTVEVDLLYPSPPGNPTASPAAAISWPAIFGGAAAAAATALLLATLGAGFGLATISPWPNAGASATTFAVSAGIWLIVVQWLSAGLGGYITGRLRTRWLGTHTHEVFFRDTAHGLLTWAVASLVGAAILASVVSGVLGAGTRAAATVAAGAMQGAPTTSPAIQARAYDVDSLFRGEKPDLTDSNQDVRSESARILANGILNGDVPATDRTYLAQIIAARTGLPLADAQKRVDDVIAQEKATETKLRQTADTARKSAAAAAFFTALSMLIGAFIACAAAAYGGSLRDEHP